MPKKPVAAPIYVLAALLVWLAAPAFAAPVRGLYEAAVPVADQGAGARDAALRRALESVLVRVTGDRHAVQNPSLGPVVARAATLVQGYGYDNGGGTGLLLRAQFDARAVDAALRAQGVPIWGSNRPSVALFAALRDDGQPRAVLDTAGVAARAPVIAAIAAARGLSLLYPDGGHAPAFSDVAMQNRELLLRTAQRIGADQTLAVRASRESGRWTAEWLWLVPGSDEQSWQSSGLDLEPALAEGLHGLADRQAQRLAAAADRAQQYALRVAGVQTLKDYARVLGYLRGLPPVRSAQVDGAQGDTLTVRLVADGEAESLGRALASGGLLQKQAAGGLFAGDDNVWQLVR